MTEGMFGRVRRLVLPAVPAAIVAAALVSPAMQAIAKEAAPADDRSDRGDRGAAGIWSASLEGVHGTAPAATVRQIARASVAGAGIRIRFGNPFGAAPVQIQSAWVGRTIAPGSAQLVPGSNCRLTFGGRRTVSIAPGHEVWSDVAPIELGAQQDVAVSVYAPGSPVNDHTFPPFAFDPPASYIGTGGDTAADESDAAFPSAPVIPGNTSSTAIGYHPGQTWWIDLITAERPFARGTLVTLGDSITDGYNAFGPPGQRWTDVLANRLAALPADRRLAIANAGISGNTVSVQPNPYDSTGQCCGPPAPQRLDRDVFSVPGVRTVLLLEGTNDIGGGDFAPSAPAEQVIAAMRSIAAQAHAHRIRIVGVTILPMCNAAGSSKEQSRLAVNQWIKSGGAFDAVLDFDAVLRDPADPTQMIADLRTDCFHPNAAGDQLLGRAIPLEILTR